MLATSRWLVGSSRRRTSAFLSMARAKASFIFQPPKGADLLGLTTFGARSEAELSQDFGDALSALGSDLGIFCDKLEDGNISIFALVMFDVACAENILGREPLKLAIGNRSHQSRLSSTVAATQTVAMALEQAQVGVR